MRLSTSTSSTRWVKHAKTRSILQKNYLRSALKWWVLPPPSWGKPWWREQKTRIPSWLLVDVKVIVLWGERSIDPRNAAFISLQARLSDSRCGFTDLSLCLFVLSTICSGKSFFRSSALQYNDTPRRGEELQHGSGVEVGRPLESNHGCDSFDQK